MRKWKVELILILAPLVFSGNFLFSKIASDEIPAGWMNVLRFLVAALAMLPVVWRRFREIRLRTVLTSAFLGLFVFGLFTLQILGVSYMTAGKSAFLTSFHVPMTPFMVWLFRRGSPKMKDYIAAVFAVAGVGLISLDGSGGFGAGEVLTLAGAAVSALMFIAADKYMEDADAILVTWIQMIAAGVFSLIYAGLMEELPGSVGRPAILAVVCMGIFSTALGFVLQNLGLKHADPAHVSLMISLESVFACILGILILHEHVGGRMLAGCALMFLAIVISIKGASVLIRRKQYG